MAAPVPLLVVVLNPDPDKAAANVSPALVVALAEGRQVVASWMVEGSDGEPRVVVLLGPPRPAAAGARGWWASVTTPGVVAGALGAVLGGWLARWLGSPGW